MYSTGPPLQVVPRDPTFHGVVEHEAVNQGGFRELLSPVPQQSLFELSFDLLSPFNNVVGMLRQITESTNM
jgi:hypothetical protein